MVESTAFQWPTIELRWDDGKVILRIIWPQKTEDHEIAPAQLQKLMGQGMRISWAHFTLHSRYDR